MDIFYTCLTLLMATRLAFSQTPSCHFYVQERSVRSCGLFGWDSCTSYRNVLRKYTCCSANEDDSQTSGVCDRACPSGEECIQCDQCSQCSSGNNYPSQCPPKCFGEFDCPNGGNCERTDYCGDCNEGYGPPRCGPLCFGSANCLRGGTCVRPNYCDNCNEGYAPPRCNPICNPSCLNGGTCTAPNTCRCRTGYTTPTCTPVCNPSCLNGGTCIAPNQCSCRTGYSTPRCTPVCSPSCLNGGTCTAPDQCTCQAGYGAPICEQVPSSTVSEDPTTTNASGNPQPPEKSSIVLIVAISASGVTVTVIVIALMVILARRRHRQKDNEGNIAKKQRNKEKKKQKQRRVVDREMKGYETWIVCKPSSTLDGYENTGQTNEYENEKTENETSIVCQPSSTLDGYENTGQTNEYEKENTENVASSSAVAYEEVGPARWTSRWMIPWSSLVFKKKVLGNGHFGQIRKGEVKLQDKVTKIAAITQLEENASIVDTEKFMEEFRTMSTIGQHANVVSILGVCLKNAVWYVAWEYLPKGNMHSFLRDNRDNEMTTVSPANLIGFALDVAKGMQHIAASGVVHCELSSRNIVLNNDMVAMVSGIGLSKTADIYVKASEVWNPCRCWALESLTKNTFTTMSDVWSFGVVVWEIQSLGRTPYANIESLDLASRLTSGYRLAKPRRCSDEIYNLMLRCWQEDPNKRPNFEQILEDLAATNHK